MPFLITGATGFVGEQLLAAMRRDKLPVRAFVRDASKLDDGIDVVEGDLEDDDALGRALQGIDTAYYLVHSMEAGSEGKFAERDRELAERFVAAADRSGVARIVYLGGIVPSGDSSEHLESREEVETTLGSGNAELVALRASMIVGERSDSFRTLAQIVDRLPVLALPAWRDTCTQPIAVADIVAALIAARDVAPGTYDVAGPDTLSIEKMIETIGDVLGKNRPTVPLPFSSAKLEGAAAAVVADSDRAVLTPLMEGLHENLVVEDNKLHSVFGITPTPFRDAAEAALPHRSPA